jgi:hypothetical protein
MELLTSLGTQERPGDKFESDLLHSAYSSHPEYPVPSRPKPGPNQAKSLSLLMATWQPQMKITWLTIDFVGNEKNGRMGSPGTG